MEPASKARRPRQSVAAKAYIFKGDRLLVLHKSEADRKRGMFTETAIDFPGGTVEMHEGWEEALRREVMEETQLTMRVVAPFNTWSLSNEARARHILLVDFLCQWESGEVVLSDEHESFEWLTLEQLRATGDVILPDIERAFAMREILVGSPLDAR